jgi:hypothetical protein
LFQDYNLRAPSILRTAAAECLKELQNDIKFVTFLLALPWKRRQTDEQTDRQAGRQVGGKTDMWIGRQTDRQTDREADRQAGGKIG